MPELTPASSRRMRCRPDRTGAAAPFRRRPPSPIVARRRRDRGASGRRPRA